MAIGERGAMALVDPPPAPPPRRDVTELRSLDPTYPGELGLHFRRDGRKHTNLKFQMRNVPATICKRWRSALGKPTQALPPSLLTFLRRKRVADLIPLSLHSRLEFEQLIELGDLVAQRHDCGGRRWRAAVKGGRAGRAGRDGPGRNVGGDDAWDEIEVQ